MQRGTKTTSVVSRPDLSDACIPHPNRSANFRLGYVKTSHNVAAALVTPYLRYSGESLRRATSAESRIFSSLSEAISGDCVAAIYFMSSVIIRPITD